VCGFVDLWVCGCVCQHDKFRTSKHKMLWNLKMHCTKISAEFELGGHSFHPAGGGAPPKCGVRRRRWENQRRLSTCSVSCYSNAANKLSHLLTCLITCGKLYFYHTTNTFLLSVLLSYRSSLTLSSAVASSDYNSKCSGPYWYPPFSFCWHSGTLELRTGRMSKKLKAGLD